MYGGQRGFMLDDGQERAAPRSASTTTDRLRWPAGGDDLHQAVMAADRNGVLGAPPGLKKLHAAAASHRRTDRCPDRLLRRPELPQEPAELGPRGRLSRARRSSRSPSRRGSRTGSRSRTPSTATRPSSCPTAAARWATRARARAELRLGDQPDHRDRELRQHRLRRPDRLDGGRAQEGRRDGHRARRPQEAPGLKPTSGSPWARPRSACSTWPTPTRRSPTAASHHDWFIVKKVTRASDGRCSTRRRTRRRRRSSPRTSPPTRRYALQQVSRTAPGGPRT